VSEFENLIDLEFAIEDLILKTPLLRPLADKVYASREEYTGEAYKNCRSLLKDIDELLNK
jgi:hypothetical protein